MFLLRLAALVLASAAPAAFAQVDYPIYGTWSSGSKNVVTGAGFANPANLSFTYPPTTGVSYSFSSTGYYEIARYRFNGNGSQPNCITGVLNWVHGTYTLEANGSIVMVPFGDGYQQIQDPCAAVSNFIEMYNDTELYQSYQVFQDPIDGYKLHLFQFDGSPVAPQFQVSTTPNMLPTQALRNVTPPGAGAADIALVSTGAGAPRWEALGAGTVLASMLTVGMVLLAV
ncbi:hypothetical protein BV25DRAFT_1634323 [Artomyces pyxidatus]|uniref:Uncharacterized protein n=1 Tax=Artomyces pyxidatus TaxID=48021 RepID=A0ACB8SK88_9AGAM|nr:hypothetical protein BV25DRAFT_1634323 [Artomyces pyxidatus]